MGHFLVLFLGSTIVIYFVHFGLRKYFYLKNLGSFIILYLRSKEEDECIVIIVVRKEGFSAVAIKNVKYQSILIVHSKEDASLNGINIQCFVKNV